MEGPTTDKGQSPSVLGEILEESYANASRSKRSPAYRI